ncbi:MULTISPECIES: (2Fe-2S)-binding protein [unclassified Parafrankia]|uniref:(2Fe-2S)-binding protein n=1 Tax=unclassified Parafrankia TaxID=2994368 RepID=UPI000DA45B62|nr:MULTISPECIES: (2Fe-2S)-binding protein [unclassified Parafrankia]TCJ40616.1 hypothetical protein E0504_04670 [Parafrankia sp. BMG5.11]SQD99670.1 conserved hypothetical protein [Parafrankia sp. Ea1.12]
MTGQPDMTGAGRRPAPAVPTAGAVPVAAAVPAVTGASAVSAAEVASALRRLAEISPYFEADIAVDLAGAGEVGGAGPVPVRVDELYRGGAALAAAVDGVNERLGGVERRVAASTLALGHAARLWSVALGCWATAGIVPDLPPPRLRVQPRLTAPVRLIVDETAGWRVESLADAVDLLREIVVEDHLRPYFTALRGETRLAPRLLWGNAASALVGSTRVLAASPLVTRTKDVPRMAAALLATPPLAGTTVHAVTSDGGLAVSSVVRRSCCLFYRVPGGGTCGDCPLSPAAERTRR